MLVWTVGRNYFSNWLNWNRMAGSNRYLLREQECGDDDDDDDDDDDE